VIGDQERLWDGRGRPCITMPVPQFLAAAGISRTVLYELIGAGEIESVKIGNRRLIVVQSYLALLDRLRAAEAEMRASR
jgi:hypothetical protein